MLFEFHGPSGPRIASRFVASRVQLPLVCIYSAASFGARVQRVHFGVAQKRGGMVNGFVCSLPIFGYMSAKKQVLAIARMFVNIQRLPAIVHELCLRLPAIVHATVARYRT